MPIQLLAEKLRAIISTLRSSDTPTSDIPTDSVDTATSTDATAQTGAGPDTDTGTDTETESQPDTDNRTDTAENPEPNYEVQAVQVANAIIEELSPESALHIGCGSGHHMSPFLDAGIKTKGVDPSSVALENAVVPEEHIEIYDLGYPYAPDDPYDVVVCLDTLEYVAERHADIIIQSISESGSTAVISIPLDPHRPEQEAWINKFGEHGMEFDESTTEQLADMIPSPEFIWSPDKVLVFRE